MKYLRKLTHVPNELVLSQVSAKLSESFPQIESFFSLSVDGLWRDVPVADDGHDGDGEEDGVGRAPLLVPPVDRAVVVDLGLGLQHVLHEVLQIYLGPVLVPRKKVRAAVSL